MMAQIAYDEDASLNKVHPLESGLKDNRMGFCNLLAEGFRYPASGLIEDLQSGLREITGGLAKQNMADFIDQVQRLSQEEWEELYTSTLDLNPPAAPYVGYQIWGESYQRGAFLAQLNQALRMNGIETDGELPDHLVPVLRYLDVTAEPLPELMEILAPAVQRMAAVLRKADPRNPYLLLLEAVLQTTKM